MINKYVVYLRGKDVSALGVTGKKDIWQVTRVSGSYAVVQSLSKGNDFETPVDRLITVDELKQRNLFKQSYFVAESYDKYMKLVGSPQRGANTMKSETNGMVDRALVANTDAAKVAATITAGKTLNSVVAKKVTPQLPMLVRGYADTAIGRVVIANIADFAVKQFMSGNAKATFATEAMMQAAMLELMDTFDLESIVSEVLDSVVIDLDAGADKA